MYTSPAAMDAAVKAALDQGGRIVQTGNGWVAISMICKPTTNDRLMYGGLVAAAVLAVAVSFLVPLALLVTLPVAVYAGYAFVKHATEKPAVVRYQETFESWNARMRGLR